MEEETEAQNWEKTNYSNLGPSDFQHLVFHDGSFQTAEIVF